MDWCSLAQFLVVFRANADHNGRGEQYGTSESARDAAEQQAMATQSSSVAFLQRTVKSLRTENERLRQELATIEARGASVMDRRRDSESSKRDAHVSTLESDIERSNQAHRCLSFCTCGAHWFVWRVLLQLERSRCPAALLPVTPESLHQSLVHWMPERHACIP